MERDEAKRIQENVYSELNKLLEKYNFKIDKIGMSYTLDNSEISLNIKCKSCDTKFMDEVEKEKFNDICKYYGFKPSDYKRRIIDGKEELFLVGFNVKARKNPCILRRTDGREFVAPISYVLPKLK